MLSIVIGVVVLCSALVLFASKSTNDAGAETSFLNKMVNKVWRKPHHLKNTRERSQPSDPGEYDDIHNDPRIYPAANPKPRLERMGNHPLKRILQDMDRTASPCDNFYKFACGNWLQRNPLPKDRSRYYRTFDGTTDAISEVVRQLLIKSEQKAKRTKDEEKQSVSKAADFYESCLVKRASYLDPADLGLMERYKPIFDILDQEGSTAPPTMRAIGLLHKSGLTPWFYPDVDVAPDDPTKYILYIAPGGLGLPDRSYYDRIGKSDIALRDRYVEYLTYLLNMGHMHLGITQKDQKNTRLLARQILELETRIAHLHPTDVDQRKKELNEQMVNMTAFDKQYDAHMVEYMHGLGVFYTAKASAQIQFVPFFADLSRLINETPRKVIKAYIVSWALKYLAMKGALGKLIYNHDFEFYRYILKGQKKQSPIWQLCLKETDVFFPDTLARLFSARYFDPQDRGDAVALIESIEHEFSVMLDENRWLDQETRQNSKEKLRFLANQIGFPDRLDLYSDVQVADYSYGEILLEMLKRLQDQDLGLLGKPIDRNFWYMTPNTVNAYYVAMRNSMTFPSGILQPPFYSSSYPPALKYGGIGVVMGHELSHAFDDHGSRYNATGFLHKIWTKQSSKEFEKRTDCLVDLFDSYQVQGVDENVDGGLTLGENIADSGGIRTSFRALHTYLNEHPEDKIDPKEWEGYDDEHFFFIQIAQMYCYQATDSDKRLLLETDVHSPGEYRVQGMLSQYDEFSRVFQCKKGTTYNPEKKCVVWEG